MTRPQSHRSPPTPERCCAKCRYGLIPEYKEHRLCFYSDEIYFTPSCLREYWWDISFNGENVGLLDGDAYDEVWGGRVVEGEDVCDEFIGR